MNNPGRRRPSLKQRVGGAKAVPVAQLIAQGDQAAQRVHDTFWDFLKLRVGELEALQPALSREKPGTAAWKKFYTMVHDIRGSSAVAGQISATAFCSSLEVLLQERDTQDPRMPSAIASHIHALNLLLAGQTTEISRRLLVSELSRAVDALPIRKA
jgi:hypothetical protein